MSCDKWTQVTEAAELMFCPICRVVCPVEKKGAATTADMGAAAQLAADAELAEKLQREEYDGVNEQLRSRPAGSSRSSNNNSRSAQQSQSQQEAQSGEDYGQSWYDWLTGAPTTETAAPPATRSAPTSGTSSRSRGGVGGEGGEGGLVSARTGEEARTYDESVGLMTASRSNDGGGGAQMAAEQKSMFSCVADSINTAAMQMYTLSADDEGNVHGVSSEGLSAMPDVSRQREN